MALCLLGPPLMAGVPRVRYPDLLRLDSSLVYEAFPPRL